MLDAALERILALTDEAFENDDVQKAAQVEPLEEIIDVMVERLRDQHIRRLKDGICSIDTGVVFLDVLNNAERISDHCSNIAVRMVGMEAGDDYDSHTLKTSCTTAPARTICWSTSSAARNTLCRWKKWKPESYKCNEPLHIVQRLVAFTPPNPPAAGPAPGGC